MIADGLEWVKETPEYFDIILCDVREPADTSDRLFSKEFFLDCAAVLKPVRAPPLIFQNGLFLVATGVPQFDTYSKVIWRNLHAAFDQASGQFLPLGGPLPRNQLELCRRHAGVCIMQHYQ